MPQRTKQMTINLSDEAHEALQRAAFAFGVAPATMAVRIIREQIARELANPEFRAKAVARGFNLEDIDRMAIEAAAELAAEAAARDEAEGG